MATPKQLYYEKRGQVLVKNLQSRHFDAFYCENKEDALKKALELIPEGASVGWGGAMSCEQIGLMDALKAGNYKAMDRSLAKDAQEREQMMKQMLFADVFLTGANGLSLDGQMVNIDGTGNRVAPICYGPDTIIVVAGMNKVEDTIEAAVNRARTVARLRQLCPRTLAAIGHIRVDKLTARHVQSFINKLSSSGFQEHDCREIEILIPKANRKP